MINRVDDAGPEAPQLGKQSLLDRIGKKVAGNIQKQQTQAAQPRTAATTLGYQANLDEKDRFNQLLKEKKDKAVNPGLAGFIANTQLLAQEAIKSSLDKAAPNQPKVLAQKEAA